MRCVLRQSFAPGHDDFREYSWDVHPGILRRLRIDKVPTTWVVDADGRVAQQLEGTPASSRLRRALADD